MSRNLYNKIKKPHYLLVFLAFLQLPTYASTMANCKKVAEIMGKALPIRKDNITIMREVGCIPSAPKNKLHHVLEIDVQPNIAQQLSRSKDISREIKPSVRNTYCTNPQIKPILGEFDLDFTYYTKQGVYVDSFTLKLSDCN